MKKYKTTLSAEHCSYLRIWIEKNLNTDIEIKASAIDFILIAALAEVVMVIKKKEVEYKRAYKITFSPVQAFALRWLYEAMPANYSNQFANRLMQINNEVIKQYAKWSS